MFGYLALNAFMTSSLGGSSFGSPQNDQVIVAAWLFAAAGAVVGAGGGPLDVPPLWQAASSDADAAPSPAAVANRRSARRESRADNGCSSLICRTPRGTELNLQVNAKPTPRGWRPRRRPAA